MANDSNLNTRQLRFALGIIEGKTEEQAYVDAGYKARGANARAAASKLLTNDNVAAFIEEFRGKLRKESGITAERVLNEYAKIAFSNMRAYSTWGPSGIELRDSEELTDDEAAAVAQMSQTITKDGGSLKFKLHDKLQALKDLAQHLGLFDKASGDDGQFDDWLEQLAEAKERYGS